MKNLHTEAQFNARKITADEAVKEYGLTRSYIYTLCRNGKIDFEPPTQLMINVDSLEKYLSSVKRGRPRKKAE